VNAADVLVTGARGQLALELLATVPRGLKAWALDRQALDITDAAATEALVAQLRPRWVINCAAYTAVDKAESEPAAARRVNADGARHVAESARRHGARLIHLSTDFVFDGRKASPYQPEDPPLPLNVYGRTKLEGEHAAARATEGDALIVRTAWLYSIHRENFVTTVLRLLHESPELRMVSDQVGSPTSATTLAATLWKLIDVQAPGGCYHCTDAGSASRYEFAVAIRELAECRLGRRLPPIRAVSAADGQAAARRPAYSALDTTRTSALAGTPPAWRESLDATLKQLLP
jgi:dTDP-4-dehydrorhamnose reductase